MYGVKLNKAHMGICAHNKNMALILQWSLADHMVHLTYSDKSSVNGSSGTINKDFRATASSSSSTFELKVDWVFLNEI